MSVSRYNIYQKICILLVMVIIVTTLKKTHKYCKLIRILNEKVYKMKSIVRINTLLMNSIVKEKYFHNIIPFPRNLLLLSTLESDLSVNVIKNILSNHNIEQESTLKRIIESVKKYNQRNRKIA